MSVYGLIHGAWHGGWCWKKVRPLLERDGHEVFAPDLPGHGNDKTAIEELSLDRYALRVCEELDAAREPVILVAHSMGGIVITQAAEYRPEKVKRLVFVTAYLLRPGQSMLEVVQKSDRDAMVERSVEFLPNGTARVKDEALKEFLYTDCTDEDVEWARRKLVPEPLAPASTELVTTAERFGRIPRTYVQCLNDRALPSWLQEEMYTALPCESVLAMNTAHSPFLSAPEDLAEYLRSL
jgi:pimeloyl-ACP methyl ester carboxylesterase